MNRDKQIEEMGEYIAEILHFECGKASCEECKWLGSTNQNADCMDYLAAEKLIAKGYRKASEVAEDIIRMLRAAGINEWRYPIVADIKKKYTESEKDK